MESIEKALSRLEEIKSLRENLAQEEVELKAFVTVATLLEDRLKKLRNPEPETETEQAEPELLTFDEEKKPQTKNQPSGRRKHVYAQKSTPQKEIHSLVEKILRHRGTPMTAAELYEVLMTQGVHMNGAASGPHVLSTRLTLMDNISCKHIKGMKRGNGYVWWFKGEPVRYSHDAPKVAE